LKRGCLEAEGDVKLNNEAQLDLLIGNQYDIDPLFYPSCSSTERHLKSQADINNFVHNLNLSKDRSELLASKLIDRNFLKKKKKKKKNRNEEKKRMRWSERILACLSEEGDAKSCNNAASLMDALG
jgi:hypothetical protein